MGNEEEQQTKHTKSVDWDKIGEFAINIAADLMGFKVRGDQEGCTEFIVAILERAPSEEHRLVMEAAIASTVAVLGICETALMLSMGISDIVAGASNRVPTVPMELFKAG